MDLGLKGKSALVAIAGTAIQVDGGMVRGLL
jgi:hypothetical protein